MRGGEAALKLELAVKIMGRRREMGEIPINER